MHIAVCHASTVGCVCVSFHINVLFIARRMSCPKDSTNATQLAYATGGQGPARDRKGDDCARAVDDGACVHVCGCEWIIIKIVIIECRWEMRGCPRPSRGWACQRRTAPTTTAHCPRRGAATTCGVGAWPAARGAARAPAMSTAGGPHTSRATSCCICGMMAASPRERARSPCTCSASATQCAGSEHTNVQVPAASPLMGTAAPPSERRFFNAATPRPVSERVRPASQRAASPTFAVQACPREVPVHVAAAVAAQRLKPQPLGGQAPKQALIGIHHAPLAHAVKQGDPVLQAERPAVSHAKRAHLYSAVKSGCSLPTWRRSSVFSIVSQLDALNVRHDRATYSTVRPHMPFRRRMCRSTMNVSSWLGFRGLLPMLATKASSRSFTVSGRCEWVPGRRTMGYISVSFARLSLPFE